MTEMSNFFALMSRMKYISRWGLMRNTNIENIEGHSLQVSMIAHALAIIGNKMFNKNYDADRIAVYALYHDVDEILTGDLPTPIKYYNPEIRDAYKEVENISKKRIINLLPEIIRDEYNNILFYDINDKDAKIIVKAADRISAYIKCLEELKSGNSEFQNASETILQTISDINLPEVQYFMDTFIPGFELTLDEIRF